MATKRLMKSGRWEFIFKNKALLPKPVNIYFDTEEQGLAYETTVNAWFAIGKCPPELLGDQPTFQYLTVNDVIREYVKKVAVGDSDRLLLETLKGKVGSLHLQTCTMKWAEDWITSMKRVENISPSTIKHYVGALARCFDWGSRREILHLIRNPLRLLPKKYAQYSDHDKAFIAAYGGVVKTSEHRDRRLKPEEEVKIRAVFDKIKPADKERPLELVYGPCLLLLLDMGLEGGMRLREMFTLTLDQVDINQSTIFLIKTKNGRKRQVPMSTVMKRRIVEYIELVASGNHPDMKGWKFEDNQLFPWWDGTQDKKKLANLSSRLSGQFGRIFEAAGVEDYHFHDLRHELTSRLFTRTKLDIVKIAKITGHSDPKMLMVYANLRGSELAAEMW